MSQQDFTNYINAWIGKTYDGDNFPRGFEIQCTDWPPKFIMDFAGLESPFGMRISGGAKDWFEDFGRSGARPQWGPEKIANTPSGFPMAGDIVVWGSNLGAGYGHVAVSDFNDNPNVVNVIEQNGIGGGKGRGGDAIRRFQRPQAPLGWIRIPAIYNKIFTSNSNNNDDMAIAQSILNKLKSNNFKLTNNGQDWYGRLQGLIDNRELVIFTNELADVATWNQSAIEKTVSGLQTDLANRQRLGTTEENSTAKDAALETQKTEFEIEKASLVQQILNLQNQIRLYQTQNQGLRVQNQTESTNSTQSPSQQSLPQYWQQINSNPATIVPVQLNPANFKNSSTKNFFQSKKAFAFIFGSLAPVLTNIIPNLTSQGQVLIVAATTVLTAVYMYVQGKVDEQNLSNQILTQIDNVGKAFSK